MPAPRPAVPFFELLATNSMKSKLHHKKCFIMMLFMAVAMAALPAILEHGSRLRLVSFKIVPSQLSFPWDGR